MSARPKHLPPKLPLSAFTSAPPPPRRLEPRALLDTHIHLYTPDQLANGNSPWPSKRKDVLNQPHTLDFYRQVTAAAEGVIFVQAEAKHDDSDVDGTKGGWDGALDEVDQVCKQALVIKSPPLVALVPWAPVLHGPAAMEAYVARLATLPSLIQLAAPNAPLSLIKSFRYLLEQSPSGFMSTPSFISGLKWLGENGYAFDMTLDSVHQAGILNEAIEVIQKTREGQQKETVFILDHFSKPNLAVEPTVPPSEYQTEYLRALFDLALMPRVYLKLSALLDSADRDLVNEAFAEYRAMQSRARGQEVMGGDKGSSAFAKLKKRLLVFLEPALESFGESRIMVGSDWPMFRAKIISTTGLEGRDIQEEKDAYAFQMALYQQALVAIGLEGDGLDAVFAGNAKTVYNL